MKFAFGEYVLCDETRRLLRGQQEVHLSPKAFELLKVLLTNHPRALSKPELHNVLWGGTHVSDGNLALLITEIRSALDDNAREPRLIRTLHAYGYAFFADVAMSQHSNRSTTPEERSHWLMSEAHTFRLTSGPNIIGRHPGLDVTLDLPGVSRRHAQITIESERAEIEDLRSKNGTSVDDLRIDGPRAIDDRARIQIGPAVLIYRVILPFQGTETLTLAARRA
jgi:DNA-binding winged helix-turn-helix (wHTH) protein